MTDDQYLLASAYLDGDVTPDERAAAEADPVVMAEVDRLRSLRAALRDVEPPRAEARAAMIAAAMAEFDPATGAAGATSAPEAAATPTRPARPAPSRRTSRWFGWERGLSLAAAAVAVLAVGAVVTNGMRGEGDDDSADHAATAPTEALESETAAGDARIGADESPGSVEIMLDAASTVAPSAERDDADGGAAAPAPAGAAEPTEATEPADLAIASATEAPASTLAPAADGSDAGLLPDSQRVLTSLDELAAFGQRLLDSPESETTGSYTDPDCVTATGVDADPQATRFFARAVYHADDVDLPVVIAVDPTSGQTLAVEAGPPCILVAAAVR